MRLPKYMSPTSLKLWESDRDTFYIQYLCEQRTPRPPQTSPMAVGSAFDAYVKSFLVERLLGKRPEFEFNTIFEQQVEPHNRDAARIEGKQVYDAYTKQGALADILLDLEGCVGQPRFETAIEGYVSSVSIALGDVPLLGKPDIFFITKKGARVIFDWKVNGFHSKYNYSPKPGYIRMRSTDKNNGQSHPKAMVMDHNGVKISVTHPLCTVEADWAAQLSIYAWLLGEDIGAKFIVAIDQIACGRNALNEREFRIAQHRSLVTEKFQRELFHKAHTAWYAIQSGHIFTDVSREQSDARCATLDAMANTPPDEDFNELLR
jgi:hypothetical protein